MLRVIVLVYTVIFPVNKKAIVKSWLEKAIDCTLLRLDIKCQSEVFETRSHSRTSRRAAGDLKKKKMLVLICLVFYISLVDSEVNEGDFYFLFVSRCQCSLDVDQ